MKLKGIIPSVPIIPETETETVENPDNDDETIPPKRSLINQMRRLQMNRSSHRPNMETKAVKRRKRKNRVRRKGQLH